MPQQNAVTTAAQEVIITFLAPLFLTRAGGDLTAAHEAARDTLAGDGVQTNTEIRLAALTIAFTVGALDSLGRSMAAHMTTTQVLHLRDNAHALHRAAHKSQSTLVRLRIPEEKPIEGQVAPDLPPCSTARDPTVFARGTDRLTQPSRVSVQEEPSPRKCSAGRLSEERIRYGTERRVVSGAFSGRSHTATAPSAQ